MRPAAPPRLDDHRAYWQASPPAPSPRLSHWLARIAAGWRPNRRVRSMGYDAAAEFFGVFIWEYLNVMAPAISEAGRGTR